MRDICLPQLMYNNYFHFQSTYHVIILMKHSESMLKHHKQILLQCCYDFTSFYDFTSLKTIITNFSLNFSGLI